MVGCPSVVWNEAFRLPFVTLLAPVRSMQLTMNCPRIFTPSGTGWRVAFVATICLVYGCGPGQSGPPRAPVQGIVNLDGETVANGTINFLPIRGSKGPVVGASIEEGEYQLSKSEGPVVGWNRVEIHWTRATGRKVEAGSPSPPGTMVDEISEAVPVQYNSQSTLEREVVAGNNTFNFDLIAE